MGGTRHHAPEGAQGEPSDADWVRAAVERYEVPLLRYARRLLADPERARDAVQDAFLRLVRARRAEVDDHLAEWLYTVVRRRAMDLRAKEQVVQTNDEGLVERAGVALETPPMVMEGTERAERVRARVRALPEQQAEVLTLKFHHGLSYRQIAKVTGLQESHVGVLLHRALCKLREQLGEVVQ